jgi:hypothetical protein
MIDNSFANGGITTLRERGLYLEVNDSLQKTIRQKLSSSPVGTYIFSPSSIPNTVRLLFTTDNGRVKALNVGIDHGKFRIKGRKEKPLPLKEFLKKNRSILSEPLSMENITSWQVETLKVLNDLSLKEPTECAVRSLQETNSCRINCPSRNEFQKEEMKNLLSEFPYFNVLSHGTSEQGLAHILQKRQILPREAIQVKIDKPIHSVSEPDRVYTTIQADWTIEPFGHEATGDLPAVVISLPLQLLVNRSDWHISDDWWFGEFDKYHSACSCNFEGIELILRDKADWAEKIIDSSLKKQNQSLEAFKGNFRNYNNLFLSHHTRNEVIFKNPIDLSEFNFKIYFHSESAAKQFIDKNAEAFQAWKIENQGPTETHFYFLELSPIRMN